MTFIPWSKSLFWSVVLAIVLSFDSASALLCRDIFSSQSGEMTLAQLKALTPQDLSEHPIEVSQHGWILSSDPSVTYDRSADIEAKIQVRDGTYPILIDDSGFVVLDHRLPDPSRSEHEAFLGTHRGLYRHLQKALGSPPQVVFAGELRVVGGQILSLSDQSGTFAPQLPEGASQSERADLIARNQRRLTSAHQYLMELGLVRESVKAVNYLEKYGHLKPGQVGGAHVRAEQVARFELECRDLPPCWQAYQFLDQRLRWLMAQGGEKYLYQKALSAPPHLSELAFEHFQLWVQITNESVLDHLAQGTRFQQGSEQAAQFEKFLSETEPFFRDVLGYTEPTSH